MRDPTAQLVAELECFTSGHIRVEDIAFYGEVTRVWCPRCGNDLTDENEEAPDGGSD